MGCAYLIVLASFATLIFACTVIGTPSPFVINDTMCYTAFGFKSSCNSATYTYTTNNLPTCESVIRRLNSLIAFEIASIVFSAATVALLILTILFKRRVFKYFAEGSLVISIVTTLVSMGMQVALYETDYCAPGTAFKDNGYHLSGGFVTFCVAWVVSMPLSIMLACATVEESSGDRVSPVVEQ